MPVNSAIIPAAVHQRWNEIRGLPDCDLSLAPEAVGKYLGVSESAIVKQRILESLIQLADYRIHEGSYHSGNEAGGDLATCEGLEAFLVPAVEEAYKFSAFLDQYPQAETFADKFREDFGGLLASWTKPKPEFSGKPYTDLGRIRKAVEQTLKATLEPFNITESAAIACRVIIHILTLKYKNREEERFINDIGKALDDKRMLQALSNAMDFLVEAFQKHNVGGSEEEKIANATWKEFAGSGWSWTAGASSSLPPMLFFTAAVVDAYAELDCYLIRPGCANEFQNSVPVLQEFFNKKKDRLVQLQLCVDMARRWIKNTVLPNLTARAGQHEEKYPDKEQTKIIYAMQKELDVFKPEWERAEFLSPVLYYNTLYALQILLWSFGDRTDDGTAIDEEAKSAINRALTMLVYNYDSVPVIKQVLGKARYTFLLPGRGIFDVSDDKANCEYLDAGFLPLLTRLLVLFVVYGVGDRNMLEPIIRDLYVELLQRRNRTETLYGSLWSTDEIEIFSTQRAIQALTFYHAYAAGKELAERGGSGSSGDTTSNGIALRNKTGMRIYLDLIGEPAKTPYSLSSASSGAPEQTDFRMLFTKKFGNNLGDYLDTIKWLNVPPYDWDPAAALQTKIQEFLETVFESGCGGAFHDLAVPEMLIESLLNLWKEPVDSADKKQRRVRESELQLLQKLYNRANGASRAATV